MDVSFLTSSRFWFMTVGVLSWYAQQKGWIGELEMKAIASFVTGFIGIRTVDRLGESAGTTKFVSLPVSQQDLSGK